MDMQVLEFISPMYPEDNLIIGIFDRDSDKISEQISAAINLDKFYHPKHPQRYQQNPSNYRTQDVRYYGKLEE